MCFSFALQEKELFEKHNTWLNKELTSKLDNLAELRRTYSEYEVEMSAKLADVSVFFILMQAWLVKHFVNFGELVSKLCLFLLNEAMEVNI